MIVLMATWLVLQVANKNATNAKVCCGCVPFDQEPRCKNPNPKPTKAPK
jgi:hypothetical protein